MRAKKKEMKWPAGRIAFRSEGQMWNAYFALPHTMEGALLIGSIARAAVENHPDRKERFMALMRDILSDFLHEQTGERPSWATSAVPAREGGH